MSNAIGTFRARKFATLRPSTTVHYATLLDQLQQYFGERELGTITAEEVGQFLELKTANKAKATRRLKYARLKAFFNFIINECLVDIKNPCAHPMIAKHYKNMVDTIVTLQLRLSQYGPAEEMSN